ncbi:MAG TPA: HEAT repeat domain-containing protein [Vicinamibacterales bacterium]|nr:HEAT repeat domain-containing protein [Vicinamibacterales bacterium]
MLRRDGRAVRREERRPAAALALAVAAMLVLAQTACKETAPPVLVPPQPTFAEDSGAIIRLEDLRVLRDAPDSPRDLTAIAKRTDARLRRRAAFALGRVGDVAGRPALEALLGDAEPAVRQAAAFGLGLLGDKGAVPALLAALNGDASPMVRGRAAEALGLIGDASAAAPIGAYVTTLIGGGALASVQPDELGWPLTPEADACRLGIYALVRLKAADVLLPAIVDAEGKPRSEWWPIAFALRRTEDPRTLAPMQVLLKGNGFYSAAFAAQGLGVSKQPAIAVPPLLDVLASATPRPAVRLEAVRGLGRLGDARAVTPLVALLDDSTLDPAMQAEVVTALGALKAQPAVDRLLDRLGDPSPTVRAAAVTALAAIEGPEFLQVLSGVDPDPDWTVRVAVVTALGTLGDAVPEAAWKPYLDDTDRRTWPATMKALAAAKTPATSATVERLLRARLTSEDVIVRATAAEILGEAKPADAAAVLTAAWQASKADVDIDARVAILEALVGMKADAAKTVLTEALADRDWAVRLKARAMLRTLDPASTAEPERPAGTRLDLPEYAALGAPTVSPRAYIDTSKGSIEIALAVLDAPITTHNFAQLADRGFFNGLRIHRVVPDFVVQDGDPRGDGNGGPGYTIRDELNDLPYLRGTVGMALSGPDTGGSQWFITHSPQPHLDAKYTVFGHVVAGMDVVDKLTQDDTIVRVRVWDGTPKPDASTAAATR